MYANLHDYPTVIILRNIIRIGSNYNTAFLIFLEISNIMGVLTGIITLH